MNAKNIIRAITPPIIREAYRHVRFRILRNSAMTESAGLKGDYSSWGAAMADSDGYDADIILDKTRSAMRKIRDGEAVYERDSVLFDEVQYSWPLLAGLMWVAARNGGRLNVLDFGGALGSSYFQNRAFLAGLTDVKWNVVEQSLHAKVGQNEFQTDELRFYNSISECMQDNNPNVILLSGVLHYLEKPYIILNELLKVCNSVLIIDRTPFCDGEKDRIIVQRVRATVYSEPISLPCWVFALARFREILEARGQVIACCKGFDEWPECSFLCFIVNNGER